MGTLICRVELNKNDGLILKVENKDGNITQTAVLNGESITITSKGDSETSTITQKPDSIAIDCKTFTLKAETITCESTKDTEHKSGAKFDIDSTGKLTMKSNADITCQTDTSKMNIKAMDISAEATNKAEIKGLEVLTDGTTKNTVKSALELKLEGLTAEMKGTATAKVEGGGMLDLKSDGIAKLKGSLTTVG